MSDIEAAVEREPEPDGTRLRLVEQLRHRLGLFVLRFRRLGAEIRRLAEWLEADGLPAARAAGQECLCLLLDGNPGERPAGLRVRHTPDRLLDYPHTAQFLAALGIRRLELDVRLESNQVRDVLRFLYSHRRRLPPGHRASGRRRPTCRLCEPGGLMLFCTRATLRDETLSVSYSYCTTCLSRLVGWFMRRQNHLRDHRTLFQAAPRYALLVGLIAVIPLVLYSFVRNHWLLIGLTIAEVLTLSVLMYLFFMTVGSVEYDNEEKAFRLRTAYGKLNRYAERIQADLRRARTVQQRILPDLANMPLSDRIDWAASFVPEAEVGGDYFDVAAVARSKVALLFADVSGHGMSAAFVTAIIKTAFQGWVDEGGSLRQFGRHLNSTLNRLTPDDSFAAVFVGTFDAVTGMLEYMNCGHNPEPWLIPADPAAPILSLSDARNTLLGFQERIPLDPAERELHPGDKLVLATDGIIEARNVEGDFYGAERFEAFLQANRGLEVGQMAEAILQEVTRFARSAPQTDDRTLLLLKIR
jgi:serine phosphatase RsbU (regulator of sigma subunit)